MASKKGATHGLYKIVLQLVGQTGTSYGIAGSTLASGSTSQAYVVDNPKTEGLAVPDRTTIDFKGGDRWLFNYQYGIDSLGSFEFTTQDRDADLTALMTNSLVNTTTNTQWIEYSENPLNTTFPAMSMLIIYRMQSTDPTTFGQTYFVNTFLPRVTINPKRNGQSYQSPVDMTYQVTPSTSTRRVNGEAFGSELGLADNATPMYHIITDNPLYMFVMRSSGTSVSAVGAYKPVTSTVGTTTASKNRIVKFVDSTATATVGVADTITVATGTFAVGTALTVASGDLVTLLYETNYIGV